MRRHGEVVGRGHPQENPPRQIVFRAMASAEISAGPTRASACEDWALAYMSARTRGACKRQQAPKYSGVSDRCHICSCIFRLLTVERTRIGKSRKERRSPQGLQSSRRTRDDEYGVDPPK